MRKIVLFICLLLSFPFILDAAEISGAYIYDSDLQQPVIVGDSFDLNIDLNISGLNEDNLGLGGLAVKLDFDADVLSLEGIYSNVLDTNVYIVDDEYYLLATLPSNSYLCPDNILYCGSYYGATLSFYVKNTDLSNTIISINEEEILLYEINGDYETVLQIDSAITSSYELKITKPAKQIIEEHYNSIIKQGSENLLKKLESDAVSLSKSKENVVVTTPKDSNYYLSNLEIEGYDIDFRKDKSRYKVILKDNVNEVKINATSESSKAKVEVKGAEDLKANDYKVTINVTAENDSVKTYTINFYEEAKETISKGNKKLNISSVKKFISKNRIYFYISGGVVAFIVLVIFIVSIIRNKKFDKDFDNFS